MENKKLIVSTVLCAIVFGGGGYYLGTKKDQLTPNITNTRGDGAFMGERRMGQGGVVARGMRGGDGFNGGEIVNIDGESITVKTQDGGSKIVFYSPSTPISKMATGTVGDLLRGKNITVIGNTNPDGSVTAESIQLRPQMQNRAPSESL